VALFCDSQDAWHIVKVDWSSAITGYTESTMAHNLYCIVQWNGSQCSCRRLGVLWSRLEN